MPFATATRQRIYQLPTQSKPSGGGIVRWDLPRSGFLARIYLNITGSITGTLSNPNPYGFASVVRRVRLTANNGLDIINISGPGYHWLLRDKLELQNDSLSYTNARSAVSAANFTLDMVLPIQLNQRDAIGLILLQTEQTLVTLTVEFEQDSNVATGATVTATVTPSVEVFTVPTDTKDWPPLSFIHQILEDQTQVPAAGDFIYTWPRGPIYLQTIHGFGFGVSGADNWSKALVRVNQADTIYYLTPQNLTLWRNYSELSQRLPGVIPIDLLGSSGLGTYDSMRDTINSGALTDLQTLITTTGGGTLYTVRRMLLPLVQ